MSSAVVTEVFEARIKALCCAESVSPLLQGGKYYPCISSSPLPCLIWWMHLKYVLPFPVPVLPELCSGDELEYITRIHHNLSFSSGHFHFNCIFPFTRPASAAMATSKMDWGNYLYLGLFLRDCTPVHLHEGQPVSTEVMRLQPDLEKRNRFTQVIQP